MDLIWNEYEVPFGSLLLPTKGISVSDVLSILGDDLSNFLTFLDNHFLVETFLCGYSITLADISLCCALSASTHVVDEVCSSFPHLARWLRTLVSHPSFSPFLPSLPQPQQHAQKEEEEEEEEEKGDVMYVPQTDSSVPPTKFSPKWNRGRDRVKDVLGLGESWVGRKVLLKGWARTIRQAKKGALLFIELNDGSSPDSLQVVAVRGECEGVEEVEGCGGTGASIQVMGEVVRSQGKGQDIEIFGKKLVVIGAVYAGEEEGTIGNARYPLAKGKHSMEFLRTNAHLRPRSRVYSATVRIRNALAYATHKFYQERGFLYIHTPLLTCSDCEGAGEQFTVTTMLPESGEPGIIPTTQTGEIDYSKDFFGRQTSLTVSGQLNVETHCVALGDCYTFGPTFRAENSHTSRHLAEFWMIEPEIAFATLEDNINLAEDYLKFCVQYALDNHLDDIQYFASIPMGEEGLEDRLRNVLDSEFVRLSYTDAIEILIDHVTRGEVTFDEEVFWGIDMASEHERYLTEIVYKMVRVYLFKF